MTHCDLEIIFRKRGLLRFLSHLDLLRLFEQACRRADLPLRYSQGFNQRVRLKSPRALGLGIESDCESLVIGLSEEVPAEVLERRLNGQLPEGLEVLEVLSPRSWVGEVHEVYEVLWPDGGHPPASGTCAALLGEREVFVERKGKDGRTRPLDIRPMLRALKSEGTTLTIEMVSVDRKQPKVSEILGLLCAREGREVGQVSISKRRLDPLPRPEGADPATGR